MIEKEPEYDPRVLAATEKYQKALEQLQNAQDLMLRKILLAQALEIYLEAVEVTEAYELRELTTSRSVSAS